MTRQGFGWKLTLIPAMLLASSALLADNLMPKRSWLNRIGSHEPNDNPKREKAYNEIDATTLFGARYQLCPQEFSDKAIAAYMEQTDSQRYSQYLQNREFNPANMTASIEQTRKHIAADAVKFYQAEKQWTVFRMQADVGNYDPVKKGFDVTVPAGQIFTMDADAPDFNQFARARIEGRPANPNQWLKPWFKLHEAALLERGRIQVNFKYLEGPQVHFINVDEGNLTYPRLFVPVPEEVAKEFARYYNPGTSFTRTLGGDRRRISAYFDLKITACGARQGYEMPLQSDVIGIRLYSVYSKDGSPNKLFFEWTAQDGVVPVSLKQ